jgi:hypothetical protein
LCNVLQGFPSVLNYCRRFAHLAKMVESDSDEATTEVISHTDGLEALERALLYVEHSKATPTDVIFMKRWQDIAASTLYHDKITDFCKKGQFINVSVIAFCQF